MKIRVGPHTTAKRTNNANNATHYVKLGKKSGQGFKRSCLIISARAITRAIIITYELLISRINPLYHMSNMNHSCRSPETRSSYSS